MPSTASQFGQVLNRGRSSGHNNPDPPIGSLNKSPARHRQPLQPLQQHGSNNIGNSSSGNNGGSNINNNHHPHQTQHHHQYKPPPSFSSWKGTDKHRERAHSNSFTKSGTTVTTTTTTAIDPKALQYASKFCSSNNNIKVSSPTGTRSNRNSSGSIQSTISLGASSLLSTAASVSTTTSVSASNALTASSTTTTFYSGVKLAPPVLSASVESIDRRASDQKTWYTIQVFPCDLKILAHSRNATHVASGHHDNRKNSVAGNGATSATAPSIAGATAKVSIPRKPYKIYRRYEDVADFADQLEEEFQRLMMASTGDDLKDLTTTSMASIASPSTSSGFHDIMLSASGSSALAERGTPTSSITVPSVVGAHVTGGSTNALPRLKSRPVLFVTKAVCLQRKEELNRYLQELFALGPIITQSCLVAEFFGIWKTDMEIHLSQEDRDPLALHAFAPNTTTTTTATATQAERQTIKTITAPECNGKEVQDEGLELAEKLDEKQEQHEAQALTALSTVEKNHSLPAASCSTAPKLVEDTNISASDFLSSSSSSSSFSAQHSKITKTTTMTFAQPSTDIVSSDPSSSPKSTRFSRRDSSGWTSELLAQTLQRTHSSSVETKDVDSDMASPTTETATSCLVTVGNNQNTCQTESDNVSESGATVMNTESEGVIDITTRTIKRLKSLRRSNTPRSQSQKAQQDNTAQIQDDVLSASSSKAGSNSTTNPTGTSNTMRATLSSAQGPANAGTSSSTKSKIMKRSKTIVFRPEVTMQPLSSKNVIPPWNRIPSMAGNGNGSVHSPISPVSPTTPGSLNYNTQSSSSNSPNTIVGESITATTPTTQDTEERPRKLIMSHSKTMSAISSLSSWSSGDGFLSSNSSASASFSSGTGSNNGHGSSNGSSGASVRSMSISSASGTPVLSATVVAPWNRIHPNADPNTHLHSLMKLAPGQTSPSHQYQSSSAASTYIPVELGRSFHKKDGVMQKGHGTRSALRDRAAVPILTQPPEARNRSSAAKIRSDTVDLPPTPLLSNSKGGPKRLGMTHSVSAPGGFLPMMTISAPEISSSTVSPSLVSRASFDTTHSTAFANNDNRRSVEVAAPGKIEASSPTKKRSPRRESTTILHSPSLSTKQPIGILKNTLQHRKASLTVPTATNMFPVQSVNGLPSFKPTITTACSSSPSSDAASLISTFLPHHGSSMATTFKIVMDADTIVALQVFEDKGFVLTLQDLRSRVQGKLLKSNIQLPDKFDLVWVMSSSSSSGSSSTLNTPVTPSPLSPSTTASASASSASIHHMSDPGVLLKTDEDLQRAIHSSRNHKVTLRCTL